ncbi:hypothetical protein [Planctomyces sp. SH-PL62]|uniref:hypothetical protein n=1 Tax=Planctomyces sp. SH-PL62 TaxID=1636152 RepID=UPI00078E0B7E|nr:hypothetical protein [Planctomyces sp. SH-PL62]AMV38309.1 hypothetical protein VT85_12785 [Planctomyces sp. SH-PL62]
MMPDVKLRAGVAFYLLTALSLSVGWGVRGNFGHEYGALIPGALAAMAAVLLSGRRDWYGRLPFFALFGALGWSFGGSISYMHVIGYTHSGHSESVLYGFAALFTIGFLWAAPGGAGTALPAEADRERLVELLPPIAAVFAAWQVQGRLLEPWLRDLGYSLDWYDSDWLGVAAALAAALIYAGVRRRVDRAASLILHMTIGWWIGFLVLVPVLGLRMTPPRGDNWAGCLGMVVGMLTYCLRNGLPQVARAAVVTGVVGGISFAGASMIKLVAVTSGYETNWHSVLEQTTGLINGLGLALAVAGLAKRVGRVDHEAVAPSRRWPERLAIGFTLLAIPLVNFRKGVGHWVDFQAVPAVMYGLSAQVWFDLGFAIATAALFALMIRHDRRPLAVVPEGALGRGQALYLMLLAIVVVGNFGKAVVKFTDQRLITEGVVYANAVVCALILLLASPSRDESAGAYEVPTPRERPVRWGRLIAAGVLASALAILADWAIVRAIYGDRFAGHAGLHIRFGPDATVNGPNRP